MPPKRAHQYFVSYNSIPTRDALRRLRDPAFVAAMDFSFDFERGAADGWTPWSVCRAKVRAAAVPRALFTFRYLSAGLDV